MRITLIHNPRAGVDQPSGAELLTLIRGAGHDVMYHSSKDDDWKEALSAEADLVVVAGGDGTVGKTVKRLIDRKVPLTILPLGTANNIAQSLGLSGSPLQLVAGWDAARRIRLDVGVAAGPGGERQFVEAFGLGLFARLMARLDARDNAYVGPPPDAEARIGHVLRLLRGDVRTAPDCEMKVELDGRDLSGKYFLLEAMNTRFIGPNLHLAPEADPGDGHLELILLGEEHRDMFDRYLEAELHGGEKPPRPTAHRGRRLQLQCDGFESHIDDTSWPAKGDAAPSGSFSVRVDSHAVEVLVP